MDVRAPRVTEIETRPRASASARGRASQPAAMVDRAARLRARATRKDEEGKPEQRLAELKQTIDHLLVNLARRNRSKTDWSFLPDENRGDATFASALGSTTFRSLLDQRDGVLGTGHDAQAARLTGVRTRRVCDLLTVDP